MASIHRVFFIAFLFSIVVSSSASNPCGQKCFKSSGSISYECTPVSCSGKQSCSQMATCTLSVDKKNCSTRGAICLEPTAEARVAVLNRAQEARTKKLAVVYALESKASTDRRSLKKSESEKSSPVEAPLRF